MTFISAFALGLGVIMFYNVKRKDVQRNNVDRVQFKSTMTEWPVQKQTPTTARNTTRREHTFRINCFMNESH